MAAEVPAALRAAAEAWLQRDRCEATRKVVDAALSSGDVAALKRAFSSPMQFGTAGLRATMGPGPACMNDLSVIQASQGLVRHIQREREAGRLEGCELSVVVGHDARHNSQRWARLVATVCHAADLKTYLYSEQVPTPLVPFAVRRLKSAAGVCVTASHNPPQDNGYKVYWSNGAQIIPPHDAQIAELISQNQDPWSDAVWDADSAPQLPSVSDPLVTLRDEYLDAVSRLSVSREKNGTCPKIVYTPVHGVGRGLVETVFARFGFQPLLVPAEQADPDPEFPTTSFPNPEEAGVLDLSMRLADGNGAPLVFANDPDADRLCIAEKQADGSWRRISGNELGALLAAWAWQNRDRATADDKYCMFASAVSSRFIGAMAKKEGFCFEQTLTGFKWMGSRSVLALGRGMTPLFAFEEAIGYMHGVTGVYDKDGVSAAATAAEMCREVYSGGGTLAGRIGELMEKYGWHVQNDSYYLCYDPAVTASIFARLRAWDGEQCASWDGDRAAPQGLRYPSRAGGYDVANVRDLTTDFDSSQAGGKPALPNAGGEMITFTFANGALITLRTSGTEPKIKYYSEMTGASCDETAELLRDVVRSAVADWLRPELNGLQPPHGS